MRKLLIIFLMLPLFAKAEALTAIDESYQTPSDLQSIYDTKDKEAETLFRYRRSRMARCGPHSDYKCSGRRVYDSCDRDNSHGIYGRCYNYGQRSPDVVCGCR